MAQSRVAEYIARTGGAPMVWGVNDCALWAASLWHEITGRDPAADLRGTYSTAFECRRIVMAAGGLENLCRRLMAGETEGDGDGIGVIETTGWDRPQMVACIFSGGHAWVKARNGVGRQVSYTIRARWGL